MTDLMRLNKKELIEMLENSSDNEEIKKLKEELEELKKKERARESQIRADLSFAPTPKEKLTHAEMQKKKDEMLRATNWRFASMESKNKFEQQMREKGLIK